MSLVDLVELGTGGVELVRDRLGLGVVESSTDFVHTLLVGVDGGLLRSKALDRLCACGSASAAGRTRNLRTLRVFLRADISISAFFSSTSFISPLLTCLSIELLPRISSRPLPSHQVHLRNSSIDLRSRLVRQLRLGCLELLNLLREALLERLDLVERLAAPALDPRLVAPQGVELGAQLDFTLVVGALAGRGGDAVADLVLWSAKGSVSGRGSGWR